ncbi:MAG: hypothetical protein GY830_04760 [Bacteroidetes bacterium]|nr:hypothetical protein [Bacteroidota bacterium]
MKNYDILKIIIMIIFFESCSNKISKLGMHNNSNKDKLSRGIDLEQKRFDLFFSGYLRDINKNIEKYNFASEAPDIILKYHFEKKSISLCNKKGKIRKIYTL